MANVLSDSYKQYKEDTAFIAGWLVEESMKCGYELTTVGQQPRKITGRLKGKARKQAKISAQNGSSDDHKHLVRVSDFIPMARKIAHQLPKINIPHIVEHIFNRAISERRRVADWFAANHGKKAKDDKDERHLHFIGILAGAYATIFPYTEIKNSGKTRKQEKTPVNLLPLHNAFDGLTVEEPPVELQNKNSAEEGYNEITERLPKIAQVVIEKTEAELEEDFFFAIECFLEEVQAIRSMIKDSWDMYNDTGHDLVTATLITNTAIATTCYVELVRQAEDRLELLVERPAKYPATTFPVWSFPAILFYEIHDAMKSSPIENVVLPSHGVTVAAAGECSHTDWCLYHTYSGIKFFLYRTQQAGPSNRRHALSVISKDMFGGRLNEETWRTLEWTAILRAATMVSSNTFALDEITRGIRYAFQTWTVPIWVSFGMQVLLDIQDIFDTSVGNAYKDLRAHLQYASKILTNDLDFQSPFPRTGNQQSQVDRAKMILKDIDDWTNGDVFRTLLRQQHAMGTHPNLSKVVNQEHYLLRNHPLRCGMLKYDTYLQLHAMGLGVESYTKGISYLAHLYAACRISYPDDPTWPDMEYLLERQDKNRLFIGALPQSYKEAQRKFALAIGASVTNFSRGKRSNKIKVDAYSAKFVDDRSILGKLYQARMYKEPTTQEATELTRKLIETIKSASERKSTLSKTRASKPVDDHRVWNSLDVLEELKEWLTEDAHDLYFDIFTMDRVCGEIWSRVKGHADGSALEMTADLLAVGANWEAMLEESKDFREYVRSKGSSAPPEIAAVRQIIQQVIKATATPANHPKGWMGDRCIRRVLLVNPKSICLLANNGPTHTDKLYLGWERETAQEGHVGKILAEFMVITEDSKEMEEKYRMMAAGEADCEDCGERHDPGAHGPSEPFAEFCPCSPITRAAWSI